MQDMDLYGHSKSQYCLFRKKESKNRNSFLREI